jgi:hypothetical protein
MRVRSRPARFALYKASSASASSSLAVSVSSGYAAPPMLTVRLIETPPLISIGVSATAARIFSATIRASWAVVFAITTENSSPP